MASFYGELSVTRGNQHIYVGMEIYFASDGTVEIDMKHYLEETIEMFPDEISDEEISSPTEAYLLNVNENCEKLPESRRALLHSIAAKLLFVA